MKTIENIAVTLIIKVSKLKINESDISILKYQKNITCICKINHQSVKIIQYEYDVSTIKVSK